ncbi:hypothetical protein INP83_12885 [Mucilaginibacter sp. 21P]|uniref:hypothetical protein n=1 Tax=Mucilaginibacter sp. 21P TaxID=2778902 RepID=UPI001C586F5E|nr:hypothetical protein [Mucilaginibacter sp. 21P]QXV63992.1 hypothetical protein INP83_12885 [Mucilaginibacter sp. 21P]
MNEIQRYYLPVSTGSLPHYFGKAIILPARYYENKPRDPQDQLKNGLILTVDKWSTATDCIIEVVCTHEEQIAMTPVNDSLSVFLYSGAIPISRVAAVYFKDFKQAETTQWNINSATAFLPDHLINIDTKTDALNRFAVPSLISETSVPMQDLTEKAKRFDILLGGLAFLKAAARKPENFPKDYFAVLSHFNATIKSQLLKAVNQKQATFNDQLTAVFSNKKSQWSDIQPMLFDEVSVSVVEAAARKAKVSLEKKYGMIELNKLTRVPNLYLLALLATYGSNKPKNLQDLISGVLGSSSIDEEKAEEIALIFGLNTRYSGLRNSYNGKELPVKFKLQSQLDYYSIESIYQYTFCAQKESGNYDYIDAIAQNIPTPDQPKASVSFWILDTPVVVKKKQDLEGELLDDLQQSYPGLHDLLERIVRKAAQGAMKTLNEKDRYIDELQQILKAKEKELEAHLVKAQVQSSITTSIQTDGLEQLEFKALKALARSKKVPAKAYQDIKPTQEGFSELITLIRSHQTLL